MGADINATCFEKMGYVRTDMKNDAGADIAGHGADIDANLCEMDSYANTDTKIGHEADISACAALARPLARSIQVEPPPKSHGDGSASRMALFEYTRVE